MKLSKYFTLEEMCFSETAKKFKIDNSPTSEEIVTNLKKLCTNVLDPIRDYLERPLRVNSGYRCKILNDKVGGCRTSQHVIGLACDLLVSEREQKKIVEWLRNRPIFFDQAIIYGKRNFIHISLSIVNRCEILKSDKKGEYEKLL